MTASLERLAAGLIDRYQLERELGQGGMATVYLAHDLRHDRRVALKVLRPDLAAIIGGERFLAEIKTTANLQHPHILPLHDSGTVDGTVFYVMPFVDGESLRDRLRREKQLPVDDAVRIAREVADALGYAHSHHVIHRDIKPENILLQGGHALVADFGIALAASATAGARMTETGMSLGTPTYMSPEQAMGDRSLDARTDIYALGAVLYEMLTGDPPFTGSTAQAIVAKVLTTTPEPITTLRKTVPPHVEEAVLAALAKLPADRPASATEFAAMLGGQRTSHSGVRRAAVRERARPTTIIAVLAALVAVGAMSAWLGRRTAPRPAPLRTVRFLFSGTESAHVTPRAPWPAAISPDGGTIAYSVLRADGTSVLYIRRMDELEGQPVPGTVGAYQPTFSPDGRWLAYEGGDYRQMKVRLDGSTPVPIAAGSGLNGADWTTGDVLVVGAAGSFHGLSHVSVGGGNLQEFTRPDSAKGEIDHVWPIALPDGLNVVFTIWSGALTSAELAITSLDGAGVTRLGLRGIRPLAVLDGELVYLEPDGAVMAVPLDPGRKRVSGTPIMVHDPVPVDFMNSGNSGIFISRGGAMITAAATGELTRLTWIGRDGRAHPTGADAKAFAYPRLSADGRRIAVLVADGPRSDVWIQDLVNGTMSRLTTTGTVTSAEWSSDGSRVIYSALNPNSPGVTIWAQPISTASAPQSLAEFPNILTANFAPTPDNRSLLVLMYLQSWQVQQVLLDSGRVVRPFVSPDAGQMVLGPVSPNGRWVAIGTDESGIREVSLRSYPVPDVKLQVSVGGGSEAAWSADGSSLYYVSGGALVEARLSMTPTLSVVSRDTVITRVPKASAGYGRASFAVSRDGSQFLFPVGSAAAYALVVVPNWLTEFRERIAAARKADKR